MAHPFLTRAQARQIDHLAVERYHMPSLLLMENAARGAAVVAAAMLRDDVGAGEVLVLAGGGNNGGDGLAAARHLHNRGFAVRIGLTVDPASYKGDALVNWQIIHAMGLPADRVLPEVLKSSPRPALVVDAVFGTGLDRAPRDPFPALAAAVQEMGTPVLAIDLPSGLDADTGQPLGACIAATRTVTFVGPKAGFAEPASRRWVGDIVVADIGCPRAAIEEALNKH